MKQLKKNHLKHIKCKLIPLKEDIHFAEVQGAPFCVSSLTCAVFHRTKFFITPLISVLLYSFYLRSISLYTHSIFHCSFALWLPELDAVFLESSAQPPILLCACIFPVYMLNSYLYPLTAPTELSCDLLIAFLGCSFKDRLIFRGLSTQGIPRSVTFHLHPVLLMFCGLFHFHK